MNIEHFKELQENEIVRKRVAKRMAHDCFRNAKTLEDMHASGWIADQEMKALMVDVVDRCYDFLMDLCNPQGDDIIVTLKDHDRLPEWNDPQPMVFKHLR